MPSRQDELLSHRYSMQRVVAAMVTHEPDPVRPPLRRSGTTALAGVLVAAITLGGFAAYGLFTGHTLTAATDPGAVLLEKRTGARYVFLPSDGRLHPVLNYTSGLLLAGPSIKAVPPAELATVPLGEPIGIPGAPDSLPPAAGLLTGAWSVCTSAAGSTVLVGAAPAGGAPADRALLVRDDAGRTHLVHQARRFRLAAGRVEAIQRALGWFGRSPWPVAAAWVDAVPAGPDLVAPRIPGAGEPSAGSGLRSGAVITYDQQFAVALPDGIAAVTEVQARLLGPATEIGADFLRLPASATRVPPGGLPATLPQLGDDPASACVTLAGPAGEASVRVNASFPAGSAPSGAAGVDRVHVERGRGALVTTESGGTVFMITETGRSHPLASPDLAARLGYANVPPRTVPARLVAYLPAGPALDPIRAGRP